MSSGDYSISYIDALIFFGLTFLAGLVSAIQAAIDDVSKSSVRNLADKGEEKAIKAIKFVENSKKQKIASTIFMFFTLTFISIVVAFPLIWKLSTLYDSHLKIYGALALYSLVLGSYFFMLVLFIPGEIGRQNSDKITLSLSSLLFVLTLLFMPFAIILRFLANLILRTLRQETHSFEEEFSEEDVISMLEIGQDSGALKEEGKKMINSIFEFDDKLAYEIMTPRTDVFSIDINDDTSEYIDELMEMRYSRIPVYEDDSDNIIGILNIKDYLIEARLKGFEQVDIRDILRPALFVPDSKNIDSLFIEFQREKQHIAILIDEYGGFSGIATMEDIIEEVMGDIDDEYDDEEMEIQQVGINTYLLDGNMYIDDINEELNIDLQSETSETIGGFIIDILGEIPDDSIDEHIDLSFENYVFQVQSVKDRRIEKLKMTIEEKVKEEKDTVISE